MYTSESDEFAPAGDQVNFVLTTPSWIDKLWLQLEICAVGVSRSYVSPFTVKYTGDQVRKVEMGCSPPVCACRKKGQSPFHLTNALLTALTKFVPVVLACWS